jgi:hypothetical protein
MRKTQENSGRTVGSPAEIRKAYLINTSLELKGFFHLLGGKHFKTVYMVSLLGAHVHILRRN